MVLNNLQEQQLFVLYTMIPTTFWKIETIHTYVVVMLYTTIVVIESVTVYLVYLVVSSIIPIYLRKKISKFNLLYEYIIVTNYKYSF